MSSLALLNEDGTFFKKLQLVSLPRNYVIPEGKILSWKEELLSSFSRFRFASELPKRPPEAFFYLGAAWAKVSASSPKDHFGAFTEDGVVYDTSNLTILVQGTSPSDLMKLRDYVMIVLNRGGGWDVRNDLNPPPPKPDGWFTRWLKSLSKSSA